MSKESFDEEWDKTWGARQQALETLYGPSNDSVLHAMIPFHLGGSADVLIFEKFIEGVKLYVTCELLDESSQIKSDTLGSYELAIAHRGDEQWGPNLICRLARYTCEAQLEPGHTMEIGQSAPPGSGVVSLLFVDYGRFEFKGQPAGVLLCIGITAEELDAFRAGKEDEVIASLKRAGRYPVTDMMMGTGGASKGGFWKRLFGQR